MIYDDNDFIELRQVGALTKKCLDLLDGNIKVGMTTMDIDDIVLEYAKNHNLTCATKGYRGFPANCCTSVNHVACHGIPSKGKYLKDGDLISVDVTFINAHGYYGDSCRTFLIGKTIGVKQKIITDVAKRALEKGIEVAKPGKHIGNIGYAIQEYIEKETTCSVVREFVGHGIGKSFHESPEIPHTCAFEYIDSTPLIIPGMVFTIEPIICWGKPDLKSLNDGWSEVAKDKQPVAQFEHTIGITKDGNEVFTK